jgi:hypothetical protein
MSVVPEMGDQESESRYRDDAQHEDRLFNAGFGHASRLAIFRIGPERALRDGVLLSRRRYSLGETRGEAL